MTIRTACVRLFLLGLAFSFPVAALGAGGPQQVKSHADSTKTRKAFLKQQQKQQKKMKKQQLTSMKKWKKLHQTSH